MLRVGWHRAVTAKSFTAHERLALLAAWHRLVEIRVDLDGQIHGLLKTFGLILGPGNTHRCPDPPSRGPGRGQPDHQRPGGEACRGAATCG